MVDFSDRAGNEMSEKEMEAYVGTNNEFAPVGESGNIKMGRGRQHIPFLVGHYLDENLYNLLYSLRPSKIQIMKSTEVIDYDNNQEWSVSIVVDSDMVVVNAWQEVSAYVPIGAIDYQWFLASPDYRKLQKKGFIKSYETSCDSQDQGERAWSFYFENYLFKITPMMDQPNFYWISHQSKTSNILVAVNWNEVSKEFQFSNVHRNIAKGMAALDRMGGLGLVGSEILLVRLNQLGSPEAHESTDEKKQKKS